MSLIDDVVGKKLPTGRRFQAKVGAGNVQKKLRAATRVGALKNLADNQDLINEIASKRQADIRTGKYGRDKRMADYKEALKDKSLTKDDKRDLKAILEHWSKGDVTKTPKIKKSSEASNRRAAAKARINPKPVRELPDFLKNRGSVSASSNPLSRQSYNSNSGSGGGIAAGTERTSSAPKPSFRPPSLLK